MTGCGALCRKIEIAMEQGTGGAELEKAVEEARQALPEVPERDPNGRLLVWIERGEFEGGKLDEAKRDLTLARKQFVSRNLDDARAAILLGKSRRRETISTRPGCCSRMW